MESPITVVRRRIVPVIIRKTADETVNNDDTLQNDDELLYAIGANETWFFMGDILFSSHASQDLKCAFTAPSGATLIWGPMSIVPFTKTSGQAQTIQGQGVSATPNANARVNGTIKNGSTAGNLQFQFAQAAAASNDTIVFAGSSLMLFKLP